MGKWGQEENNKMVGVKRSRKSKWQRLLGKETQAIWLESVLKPPTINSLNFSVSCLKIVRFMDV